MAQSHYTRLVAAAQGGLEVLDVLIETLHLEPLKEDPRIKELRGVLADIADADKCCVCKQLLPEEHSCYSYPQEGREWWVCSEECFYKVSEMLKTRPIDTLAQDQKELPAEYAAIVSKNFWGLV
jgi:hypothetical protein